MVPTGTSVAADSSEIFIRAPPPVPLGGSAVWRPMLSRALTEQALTGDAQPSTLESTTFWIAQESTMSTSPARSTSQCGPPSLTHAHEGDIVGYHFGMTIRMPYSTDLWGPGFLAMPAMSAVLDKNRAA